MQLSARLAFATFASLVACGSAACSSGGDITTGRDATPDFDAAVGVCPPQGEVGVQVGDFIPRPALVDCDGQPFDLGSVCGKTAAHQFHFAGW